MSGPATILAVVLACRPEMAPAACTAASAAELRHAWIAASDCGTARVAPVSIDGLGHYAFRLLRADCTPQRRSRAALDTPH